MNAEVPVVDAAGDPDPSQKRWPSPVYSSPDTADSSLSGPPSEEDAVHRFVEKYDSLGKLMDGLRLSGDASPDEAEYEELDASARPVDRLTERDLEQVEQFFKSHKTYVYVCRCLANLYFSGASGQWELARTGVPVLLLDKGETKARAKRMLQIALSERGTGFVLWRDVIDNLSDYRAPDAGFHTMYLSSDHRRTAGLSFDARDAALEFAAQVETLTSDPLNISLSVPKPVKNGKKKKVDKFKMPRKCDISQPCYFQHVTSLDLQDKEQLFTLATMVGKGRQHSV